MRVCSQVCSGLLNTALLVRGRNEAAARPESRHSVKFVNETLPTMAVPGLADTIGNHTADTVACSK